MSKKRLHFLLFAASPPMRTEVFTATALVAVTISNQPQNCREIHANEHISYLYSGFSANLAVYQVPDIGWRLQLGSAFIPAVPLLILIWWAPESPRWYIKQNCYPQAYRSLLRLRNVPLQAARDLYYMHVQIELENKMLAAEQQARDGVRPGQDMNRTPVARDLHKAALYVRRFVQLFTISRVRRATVAACTVMLAQQMCGINVGCPASPCLPA